MMDFVPATWAKAEAEAIDALTRHYPVVPQAWQNRQVDLWITDIRVTVT